MLRFKTQARAQIKRIGDRDMLEFYSFGANVPVISLEIPYYRYELNVTRDFVEIINLDDDGMGSAVPVAPKTNPPLRRRSSRGK